MVSKNVVILLHTGQAKDLKVDANKMKSHVDQKL